MPLAEMYPINQELAFSTCASEDFQLPRKLSTHPVKLFANRPNQTKLASTQS
jgi:hypothetical protein